MRIEQTLAKSGIFSGVSGERAGGGEAPSFGQMMRDALERVNQLQQEADESTAALAFGTADNLHQVMIAGERAQLALQLTIAVRNKVVEAYQEISRMQI